VIFDATWACAACRLRFPEARRCPECGAGDTFDLSSASDRQRFWRRARASERGSRVGARFLLARAGDWMPKRPWIVLLIGAALLSTAPLTYLFFGVHGFQNLYIVTNAAQTGGPPTVWDGLSTGGFEMLAASALGALMLLFMLVAFLGTRAARKLGARDTVRKLRVIEPLAPREGATTLRGRARGDVTSESPVAAKQCIAFGLTGTVNGSPVDDAAGADFMLELEKGERVLITLGDAVLEAPGRGERAPAAAVDYLAEVLADRGLGASAVDLVEHVLCDGDEVSVIGELHESEELASGGYRDAKPARVLRGTRKAPVWIRKAS
jgi:hypothetical protein